MVKPHTYPIEATLDECIKCNICTSACPVSSVTDLFPGPKYSGPQSGRFRHSGQNTPDRSVDYCSGCRVCNMVCPNGVKIAEINARARATLVKQGKIPFHLRVRNNMIARAELIGKIARPFFPISNILFFMPLGRILVEKTLGISRNAPFPRFASQKFSNWFRRHKNHHPENLLPREKVVYFHGCSTQYYEPNVGIAAIRVMEANGLQVIVPSQNCCGLPLLSNGEFQAAHRYHKNNVTSLIEYARQGIPIVGTSTSCTLSLKEEAPELLDMQDEDTKLVARMTYDLSEFLLTLLEKDRLNLNLNQVPLELPYHIPCQYRAHRIGSPGCEILDLIPGLKYQESQADCCGIAGTYGYKSEKYQISMMVGRPLFEFLINFDAPLVICDSETCRWQITHATGIPAVHPIELLAFSYGFEIDRIQQAVQDKV